MAYETATRSKPAWGYVRPLTQQEELPLLRDHLLRLDAESRHNRFNGFLDDSFIESYAARCKALLPGDTVVVTKLDRLARSSRDLHNILPDHSKGTQLRQAITRRLLRRSRVASCTPPR